MTVLDRLMAHLDRVAETGARRAARVHGRRSFLANAGKLMMGAALVPVLPFDRTLRGAMAAESAEGDGEFDCGYWRYCALDGRLCNTAGGDMKTCPPGSEASSVAWVGTCSNPDDGRAYLVSYNDCCGRTQVSGSTYCFRNEGERPGYRMGLYNDINWCMANTNQGYHCTVAVLVGVAE